MNPSTTRRWLHRFAWLTATLTLLLPVTTGAFVTTLKAGMVFADWPSSDGYSMLAYPLMSADRDQFAEHLHRLSGMTIGLLSMALAGFAWIVSCGRVAKCLAAGIFGVVFVQGLLGGARVLLGKETLALLHGDFAAAVFSLMAVFVMVTSVGWESRSRLSSRSAGRTVLAWAVTTAGLMSVQYFIGGVLRHLKFGWAWNLHPWFATAPLVAVLVFAFIVRSAESVILRRCATALVGLVVSQVLLGLATWYVRYGVPAWGVVATHESFSQVVVCSLHKVLGMLALMMSVVSVVCASSVLPVADHHETSRSAEFNASMMGVAT
jgi:heme a synthase